MKRTMKAAIVIFVLIAVGCASRLPQGGITAITVGPNTTWFTKKIYAADPATIRHEAVHRYQWRKYGVTFPVRYFVEWIRHGYYNNRFEKEAEGTP
jgi:hypothetical protein